MIRRLSGLETTPAAAFVAFCAMAVCAGCPQERSVSGGDRADLELRIRRGDSTRVRAITVLDGTSVTDFTASIVAAYTGIGALTNDGVEIADADEAAAGLRGTIELGDLQESGGWRGEARWIDEIPEIPSTTHVDFVLRVLPESAYASTSVAVTVGSFVSATGDDDVDVHIDVELEEVP